MVGMLKCEPLAQEARLATPPCTPTKERRSAKSCNTSPKRPMNSFMLYRRDKKAEFGNLQAPMMSKLVGALWQQEPPVVKAFYRALAEQERAAHEVMYPTYRYSPQRRLTRRPKRSLSEERKAERDQRVRRMISEYLQATSGRTVSAAAAALSEPSTNNDAHPIIEELSIQPFLQSLGVEPSHEFYATPQTDEEDLNTRWDEICSELIENHTQSVICPY